jgi:hypothetical protein
MNMVSSNVVAANITCRIDDVSLQVAGTATVAAIDR